MGFYVQYSEEHFENIVGEHSKFKMVYTPMISFCDLTVMQLSKDSDHLENFGKYGIGLTKDWGIEKRVSPVIYAHEKSQPTAQLYNLNLYDNKAVPLMTIILDPSTGEIGLIQNNPLTPKEKIKLFQSLKDSAMLEKITSTPPLQVIKKND